MDIANDLMTKNDFSPAIIVYIDQSYSRQYFMSMNINKAGADIEKVWEGREGDIWGFKVRQKGDGSLQESA